MPVIYCSSCGSPNKYDFSKPEKCSECHGDVSSFVTTSPKKYTEASAVAPVRKVQPKLPRYHNDDEPLDDELDFVDFSSIKKLEVKINIPEREIVKASDVVGTGPSGFQSEKKRKRSSNKVLEDFREKISGRTVIDIGEDE
jgi:hypothetical protein